MKNWHVEFFVRGSSCELLHVEAENVELPRETMLAIAHGTVIYGQIIPGGVNTFAFGRGFENVVYTNAQDRVTVSFGTPTRNRSYARSGRLCTEEIAAGLRDTSEPRATPYTPPPFVPISWERARPGVQLFDASYELAGTIASVDREHGLIFVRFTSGSTEPKLLEAMTPYYYVAK